MKEHVSNYDEVKTNLKNQSALFCIMLLLPIQCPDPFRGCPENENDDLSKEMGDLRINLSESQEKVGQLEKRTEENKQQLIKLEAEKSQTALQLEMALKEKEKAEASITDLRKKLVEKEDTISKLMSQISTIQGDLKERAATSLPFRLNLQV